MATTKRHPIFASGTGDAFTALFTASYLGDRDLPSALNRAVSAMAIIVGETAATGSDELKIIETQDRWVAALKG